MRAHEGGQQHANPFDMFANFFGGREFLVIEVMAAETHVTPDQHHDQVRKGPTSLTEFEVSLADMYTGASIDVRRFSR